MSTNLYYVPANAHKPKSIGYAIKFVLGPILWDHDGTLGGEEVHISLDYKFYDKKNDTYVRMQDFLVGLSHRDDDLGKDASTLLKLLNKHEDGILISLKS